MSVNIDQNIVELEFDNSNFEKNVKTSLNTLDTLKNSISNVSTGGSLEGLRSKLNNMNFDGLHNSVEMISQRFTNLGIVGVTALQNITNTAINAGKRMLKSLTVDQIKEGFNEYELKMNSVKTIMASTGASVEDVNKYLNELNEYSDKTIYRFSDMTQNIGKFTNAGVKLPVAVQAMKGISNAAALAGANANEASRAMYNLAQALSMGYVQYIDWKSIENANMATQSFKKNIAQTAVDLKQITKLDKDHYQVGKKTYTLQQLFKDGLKDQWLTTKVLTKTLGEYADENTKIGKKATKAATEIRTFTQLMDTLKEAVGTGWADSFEAVIGNSKEAKNFWTKVNSWIEPVISASSNYRKEMLNTWKDKGGRKDFIKSLQNIVDIIKEIGGKSAKAFRDIFPKVTADNLLIITKNLKKLTDSVKDFVKNSKSLDGFYASIKAIAAVAKIPLNFISSLLSSIASGLKMIFSSDAGKGTLVSISKSLESFANTLIKNAKVFDKKWFDEHVFGMFNDAGFDKLKKKLSDFTETFSLFFKTIKPSVDNIKKSFSKIRDDFSKAFDSIDKSFNKTDKTQATASKKISVFKSILDVVAKAIDIFQKTVSAIANGIGSFVSAILGSINFNDLKSFTDIFTSIVNTITTALVGGGLISMFQSVTTTVENTGKSIEAIGKAAKTVADIPGTLSKTLDTISNTLTEFSKTNKIRQLMYVSFSILALAFALKTISTIDVKKFNAAIGAFTTVFIEFMAAITAISYMTSSGGKGSKTTKGLKKFFGKFKGALMGGDVSKIISLMVGLSISILILAGAFKRLAKLSDKELITASIALTIILTELVGAVAALKKISKNSIKQNSVGNLLVVALAVDMLIPFLKSVGKLSLGQAITAIATFEIVLWSMIGAIKVIKNISKNPIKQNSVGNLLVVALAVDMLIPFLKSIGSMSWDQALTAIVSFEIVLWSMIGAMKAMKAVSKNPIKQNSVGNLLVVALAVDFLIPFLKSMGSMSWDQALTAIVGFEIVLWSMVGAVKAMKAISKNPIKQDETKNLLIIALAIDMVIPALKTLSSLSPEQFAQSIGGFIVILGGLLVAVEILKIISSSSANIMEGASVMLMVAAAVLIVSMAFKVLNGIGSTNIIDLSVALMLFFTAIGVLAMAASSIAAPLAIFAAIVLQLGIAMLAAGIGMAAFGTGLFLIGTFGAAGISNLIVIIEGLIAQIPKFAVALADGLVSFLDAIADDVPKIIASVVAFVMELLFAILDAIIKYMPALLTKLITILGDLLDGLALALHDLFPKIVNVLVQLIVGLIDYIKGLLGINSPSTVFLDIAKNCVLGLLNGFTKFIHKVTDWFRNKWKAFRIKMHEKVKDFINAASEFIGGLKKGFENGKNKVLGAIKTVYENVKAYVKDKVDKAKSIGQDIINGIKEGINAKKEELVGKLKTVADLLPETVKKILGIASPSKVFMSIGRFIIGGLIKGISNGSNMIEQTMASVSNMLASAIDTDATFSPVISPVLDLSNVRRGASSINGMFNDGILGINQNAGAVNNLLAQRQANSVGNSDVVNAIDRLKKGLDENPTNVYNVGGVTYGDDSRISAAVNELISAIRVEGRV